MSVVGTLNAERIKLSTTRSPAFSAIAVMVLCLGLAAAQGDAASAAAPLDVQTVATGVAVFGVPVLMVVAALAMTGEYRCGTIRTTFTATADRFTVLTSKAVVTASFSAVVAALAVIGAVSVAALTAPGMAAPELSLALPATWRTAGAMAVFAFLAALLGVAVAALLRHSAGAVAVLLLWPLVVEPIVANLPGVGSHVGPYLPFANAFVFVDVRWLYVNDAVPWGPLGSLAYFAAVTAGLFALAVVTLNVRDA